MARPIKNNASYFSHDTDMRDDPKIKAVRRKYGHEGYSIYCMLLEFITDRDYFKAEINDLNYELMAGDFDIETEKLKEMIEYFIALDLFQTNRENSEISCFTLGKRLENVVIQREKWRKSKFSQEKTPQSKVKNSKVKKRIVNNKESIKEKLEIRRANFYKQIFLIKDYSKEMLEEFFAYWSEPNKSNTKFKMEMEKTWDLKRRLKRWAGNDFSNVKTEYVDENKIEYDKKKARRLQEIYEEKEKDAISDEEKKKLLKMPNFKWD